MCGRYRLDADADPEFCELFSQAESRAERLAVTIKTSGDIFPSDIVPVVAPDMRHREPGCFPMRWGFPHPSRNLTVINARCETAQEKAFFAVSTEDRRCLIPASAYYEWSKKDGIKTRYAFSNPSRKLFLAGLYIRSSKEKLPSFSILTRDAGDEIAFIHKRMPLIIPQDRVSEWLSCDLPYQEAIQYAETSVTYEQS